MGETDFDKIVEKVLKQHDSRLLQFIQDETERLLLIRESFLKFITYIVTTSITIAGVIAAFIDHTKINPILFGLAELLLVFTVVYGIISRHELFKKDFTVLSENLLKSIPLANNIRSYLSDIEEQSITTGKKTDPSKTFDEEIQTIQTAETFFENVKTIELAIRSNWIVYPFVAAILIATIAFLFPTPQHENHDSCLNSFFNTTSKCVELKRHP